MTTPPAATELRDRARRVALEAAEAVRRGRRHGIGAVTAKSSATDPVTEVDRSTESLIVERLLADRPDDSVLGEESGHRDGGSEVRWVIDPIDGTVNFVYGIPAYGVSIAAEVSGELVAGAVVDVARDEVCSAAGGHGAEGPQGRLTTTAVADPARALIGTGFGYRPERRRAQADVLTRVLPSVRDIRRCGSAALDLCAVARGRLDGFYELGLEPWDRAAGTVIVREAGGVVRELPVEHDDATVTVAAGPDLIDPLVDLLRDAGAVA
jgi:myo-inositol-1(or 4)-monophosphatase